MMLEPGRFITLEGGEGAGKSTQARRLAAALAASGRPVLRTREPGGTPGAERIRELLLGQGPWDPVAEAMLHFAARREHLMKTIRPFLDAGGWVVCDRFADSTRAYQGGAGGVAPELISALEAHILQGARPDLTLVFDLPVEIGLARAEVYAKAAGHGETRFESKGVAFHERLRAAFQRIAAAEPDRCALIDAGQSIEDVEAQVWAAVETRLAVHG